MNTAIDFIKKLQLERTDYKHASQVRTLTNSLLQLSTGIYTEPERFVYELLQNAVDAFTDTSGDTLEILIKVEGNKFIFLHNGKPFSEKDVEGICDVGNGTKSNDSKKIGYKGIGFKSVFMPSVNRVSIKSGDFFFMFDKNEATHIMPPFPEGRLTPEEVPWQVIPISQPQLETFNIEGFNVVTIVETTEARVIANKVEGLFSNLQFLLFLRSRNVNIRFERDGKQVFSVRKERSESNVSSDIYEVTLFRNGERQSSWLLYSKEVEVSSQVKEDIAKDFNTPNKLKGADRLEISFAVNVVGNMLNPLDHSTVFTFLPTSYNNLKEPFLINANFITDAGRQQLHQGSEWNRFIFKNIPELYLSFIAKIANQYTNYAEVLPHRYPAHDSLTDLYRNALEESFRVVPFVPNAKRNRLLKIGEVLIDKTGIFNSVIPSRQLYDFINKTTQKQFPEDNLVDDNGLSNYAHDKVTIIKSDDVIQILSDSHMMSELSAANDIELIQYLCHYSIGLKDTTDKTKFDDELKHCPFLLDEENNWDCPLNIYLPSDFKEHNEQADGVTFLNDIILRGVRNDIIVFSWLKDCMGLKELDDSGFVKYLLCHPDFINTDNAISIGKYLFKLWKRFNFFEEEYSQGINSLLFISKDGSLRPICNLYLGSKYRPDDDIEAIYPNKSLFISDDYASENDEDDWSFFLKKCGIGFKIDISEEIVESKEVEYGFLTQCATTFRDKPHSRTGYCGFQNPIVNINFRLYYFSIIDPQTPNYALDKLILSRVLSRPYERKNEDRIKGIIKYWGEYRGVPPIEDPLFDYVPYEIKVKYNTYLEYVMAEHQKFPTTTGSSQAANEIFINTPTNILLGSKYLPILNLEGDICDSWRQKLPFKQTLSTQDLLTVLEKVSEDEEATKEEIRERVSAIYREIIERGLQSTSDISNWAKTHKLYSQSGGFLPPSELTYITIDGFKSGRKVYCENVGRENRDKLLELLRNLGIRVITPNDIHPTFVGDYICDDIKRSIISKIQYLALVKSEDVSDFEQNKASLEEKILSSTFFKCSKISLTYGNEDDVLQKQTFAKDGNFYYIGDFSAAKIEPLLHPLCKFLSLKNCEGELMVILLTKSHKDLADFLSDKGYDVSLLEDPNKRANQTTLDPQQPTNHKGVEYEDGIDDDTIMHPSVGDQVDDSPTIKKGDNDHISTEEQYEAQLEAQRFLIEQMPYWEFPDGYGESKSNGMPKHFSTVSAKDENGKVIPFVLKSYKIQSEPFKINPEEWDFIIKKKAHIFIYDGYSIREIKPMDLIMNQSNISITFSTENLDIEDCIDSFANALHYFKDLHFDFESFNISKRAKSIKAIYNTVSGVQLQTNDDDL